MFFSRLRLFIAEELGLEVTYPRERKRVRCSFESSNASSLHSDRVQNIDNLQYTIFYKFSFFKRLRYVGEGDVHIMYVANFCMSACCIFVGPGAGVGRGGGGVKV